MDKRRTAAALIALSVVLAGALRLGRDRKHPPPGVPHAAEIHV